MKQRELDKQELDRLGRGLLASARLSDAEIDRIAGAPNLLAAVRAGIEAERAAAHNKRARAYRFGFQWRTAFVSLAVLIALTMFAIAFVRRPLPPETAVKAPLTAAETTAPEISDARAYVQNPPDEADGDVILRNPYDDRRPKLEKATFKPAAPPRSKPAPGPRRAGRQPSRTNDGDGVFYALPYAGHSEAEDLRIVRTELSPKSLFALGVNVSVENESAKIKTDLLVGTDGQARAIRFVK